MEVPGHVILVREVVDQLQKAGEAVVVHLSGLELRLPGSFNSRYWKLHVILGQLHIVQLLLHVLLVVGLGEQEPLEYHLHGELGLALITPRFQGLLLKFILDTGLPGLRLAILVVTVLPDPYIPSLL